MKHRASKMAFLSSGLVVPFCHYMTTVKIKIKPVLTAFNYIKESRNTEDTLRENLRNLHMKHILHS